MSEQGKELFKQRQKVEDCSGLEFYQNQRNNSSGYASDLTLKFCETKIPMNKDLNKMDLIAIRNLFIQEMKSFLIALEKETPEEIRIRKQRIKEIDKVLEEKKLQSKSSFEKNPNK